MQNYLDLLQQIKFCGEYRGDRTGTGTQAIFGTSLRCNLADGFPLLTTKRVWVHGVLQELLWFLSGETNIKRLTDNKVYIWDEWATEDGELGPVYGVQWRKWKAHNREVDQIAVLIEGLKNNPNSRRHLLSAWNVADLPSESLSPQQNALVGNMALAPCHLLAQFFVSTTGKLSIQVYQRSADILLGVPFDLASYAFLTHMIAHVCGYTVGEMVYIFGDTHIYNNHREQVDLQLTRKPMPLPTLKAFDLRITNIDDFVESDFQIDGYNPAPAIKAPISI
jgi:thymidylate synthase